MKKIKIRQFWWAMIQWVQLVFLILHICVIGYGIQIKLEWKKISFVKSLLNFFSKLIWDFFVNSKNSWKLEHELECEQLEAISRCFVCYFLVVTVKAWQSRCVFGCWKCQLSCNCIFIISGQKLTQESVALKTSKLVTLEEEKLKMMLLFKKQVQMVFRQEWGIILQVSCYDVIEKDDFDSQLEKVHIVIVRNAKVTIT